jgi:hypothetical protein
MFVDTFKCRVREICGIIEVFVHSSICHVLIKKSAIQPFFFFLIDLVRVGKVTKTSISTGVMDYYYSRTYLLSSRGARQPPNCLASRLLNGNVRIGISHSFVIMDKHT